MSSQPVGKGLDWPLGLFTLCQVQSQSQQQSLVLSAGQGLACLASLGLRRSKLAHLYSWSRGLAKTTHVCQASRLHRQKHKEL